MKSVRSIAAGSTMAWAIVIASAAPARAQPIPLCPGLTIVGAVSEPHGDYEPITRVESLDARAVTLRYSTQVATRTGTLRNVNVRRVVLQDDLQNGRLLAHWFNSQGAVTIPGATAIGTSTAVLRALKQTGEADLAVIDRAGSGLQSNRDTRPNIYDHQLSYKLRRVGTVTFDVTVNGVKTSLPAVHARGESFGEVADFYFLDDERNPLRLAVRMADAGRGNGTPTQGQVVKISYDCPSTAAAPTRGPHADLERALSERRRADVFDIHFNFASDEIRPESEDTVRAIAEILRRHPDWTLNVTGHTDSIAGDAYNLDLSRRRAAAVKSALVTRYQIAADRLATFGAGEASPVDSNETVEGRARNRRVELVRP